MIIRAIILAILISSSAHAARIHPERWYQKQWCDARGGEIEVTLPDRTRCDCVTASHAVEFDFADKWAESLGQALNYARMTGRRAGIVLILESETDKRHWDRLNAIIEFNKLPVDTWKVAP